MKIRLLITLTTLFALASVSIAQNYTFHNGYYWANNQAHTRTLVTSPGYWYLGCYYPGSSSYQYQAVQVPTPADPNWRNKLLELAAQRDKFEGEIRRNTFEQNYFLEAVKSLGLQGNFNWNNYGVNPNAPNATGYGHAITSYGANATTQYGYSYNTIASLYGDTNLNQLYLQAAQLSQNAQKLSSDATANFSALVGQEGTNRSRVAEILAKGQMAQQILQSLTAAPTTEVKGFTFQVAPNGTIEKKENNVDPGVKDNLNQQFSALVTAKCASCHSGASKKGAFDIAMYPSLNADQKQAVWTRLLTDDPKFLMPRNPDGSPGKRLTQEELRLFLLN